MKAKILDRTSLAWVLDNIDIAGTLIGKPNR
jgi:hypothetical protein